MNKLALVIFLTSIFCQSEACYNPSTNTYTVDNKGSVDFSQFE